MFLKRKKTVSLSHRVISGFLLFFYTFSIIPVGALNTIAWADADPLAGTTQTETFSADGNWAVPAGITSFTVKVLGAGGKGGEGAVGTYVAPVANPVGTTTNTFDFTSASTGQASTDGTGYYWDVPVGITSFDIELWGAGGKGGAGAAYGTAGYNGPGGGGGGGAGAYGKATIQIPQGVTRYFINVGSAGNPSTVSTSAGVIRSAGNGGDGRDGSGVTAGGGFKTGYTDAAPGGAGGVLTPSTGWTTYSPGAVGTNGGVGGTSNSASFFGQPGAGGSGASSLNGGAGGAGGGQDIDRTYSYCGLPGSIGGLPGAGGGGGCGYGGAGAVGSKGRVAVSYSYPTTSGTPGGNGGGVLGGGGGGGGGAGGYATKTFSTVAGTNYNFVIGDNSVNDGATVFKTGTGGILIGATTGANGANGLVAGTSGAGGAGGTSLPGTTPDSSSVGASGVAGTNGTSILNCPGIFSQAGNGGNGGASTGGTAGVGGVSALCQGGSNGAVGTAGSGGGGGSGYSGIGASGSKGQIQITYTYPSTSADTVAPVITLNGTNPTYVAQGSAFADLGATAIDAVDGNVAVTVSGAIVTATSTVGVHSIIYSAIDVAGNSVTATRTVIVYDSLANISCSATGSLPTAATIGTYTILAWPASDTTSILQSSTDLVAWTNVTLPQVTVNNCHTVSFNTANVPTTFFQLIAGTTGGGGGGGPTISCPTTGSLPTSTVDGTNIILAWPASDTTSILQSSPDLSVWTNVSTAVVIINNCNTVTVSATPVFFYRLVTPPPVDTTAPVVTVIGSNPAFIVVGSTFVDLGVTVTDNVNNNLGFAVNGSVDASTVGSYTLTYTATDSAGNVGTATRIVNVYDPLANISCSATGSLPTSAIIGSSTILAWPASDTTSILQFSTNLISWTDSTSTVVVFNNCNTVTTLTPSVTTFYQLTTPSTGGGGGTASSTVDFTLTPSSTAGTAPLNGINFGVVISGTATGTSALNLDCESDSVVDFSTTTTQSAFTTTGTCNYPTAGTYVAHATITRGGVSSTTDATITVTTAGGGGGGGPTISCPTTGSLPTSTIDGTNIILAWPASDTTSILQSSPDLSVWTNVSTAVVIINNCNTVTASSTPTLFYRLTTPPNTVGFTLTPDVSTGVAPLNGVHFGVAITGTATGTAILNLDCTNDGVNDFSTTSNQSNFTTQNSCSYPSAGIFTAHAQITRGGISTTTDAIVTATPAGNGGGGTATSTVAVTLTPSATSGVIPLNGITFAVLITGTATGTSALAIDCDNNGTANFSTTTTQVSFTTTDSCNYPTVGTYVVHATIIRGGVSSTTDTTITVTAVSVTPPPPASNGGGGGGGGGNGPPISLVGPSGTIPTATTTVTTTVTTSSGSATGACSYMTGYVGKGKINNESEVLKLQIFLKSYEKMNVPVNGIFDDNTEASIKAFQSKYSADILEPWGTTTPTGYSYITTVRKINYIYCTALNSNYKSGVMPALIPDSTIPVEVGSQIGIREVAPSLAVENNTTQNLAIGQATTTIASSTGLAVVPSTNTVGEPTPPRSVFQNTATVFNSITVSLYEAVSALWHSIFR